MNPKDVPKLCTWNEDKEEWRCNKCSSLILGHEQIVSLTVKGTLMGFGETTRRIVPYCPKCESKPSDVGHSYYGSEEDPDVQDMKIILKMGEKL